MGLRWLLILFVGFAALGCAGRDGADDAGEVSAAAGDAPSRAELGRELLALATAWQGQVPDPAALAQRVRGQLSLALGKALADTAAGGADDGSRLAAALTSGPGSESLDRLAVRLAQAVRAFWEKGTVSSSVDELDAQLLESGPLGFADVARALGLRDGTLGELAAPHLASGLVQRAAANAVWAALEQELAGVVRARAIAKQLFSGYMDQRLAEQLGALPMAPAVRAAIVAGVRDNRVEPRHARSQGEVLRALEPRP